MSSHWTSETDSLEVEVSYFHIGIIPMCPYLDFLNEIVFFLHSKHIMPLPCLNQDIPLFFIGGMTSH
jgi:hypothetical protein